MGSALSTTRVTRVLEVNDFVARGVLAVCIGTLILFVMIRQGGPIFDDPYILFRYADHLVTGRGWNFNPTSSSENAVTSNFYVMVLAAMSSVGLNVISAASIMFFVTTFSAAAFTGLALERSGRRIAGALAALMIASSPMLSSFRGMESSLFLCLVAAALYSTVSRCSPMVTGVVLGLLILTRPDGLAVGVALVFVFFILDRDRRLKSKGWLLLFFGSAIPVVLFGIYAIATSLNPFPSTLAAKIAQLESGLWLPYLGGSREVLISLHEGGPRLVQFFLLVLVIAAVGGVVASARQKLAWQIVATLVVASVGLATFYTVVGIPAYPWYYAIPIYTLLVLASIGFDSGLRALTRWPLVRLASTALVTLVLVFSGLWFTIDSPTKSRVDSIAIGEWIRDNTDPTSTVAAMEIGSIGWFSERDMVDYLGLLDSAANEAVARGDFLWWASHYQPDYWVSRGYFADRTFFESACFRSSFTPVFRAEVVTVYRRTQQIPGPEEC